MLQSFDLEFQPFIQEIDAKEKAIQEFAGAATMKGIGSMYIQSYTFCLDTMGHAYTPIVTKTFSPVEWLVDNLLYMTYEIV